ncbi:ArsR/SmtB family transcription factor [Pseudonocardia humida]|uniref:Helix-turn-helix transcriptional regulator n=1 Tax=Pseudonocardia humida TaxID=2800819 RepID=A0ABT0ZS07_9PSEU|nr:helix-turn-helix domain-containing protein [Pseudonocardia humida]MCO1653506.1 helix-turn-helix transcriptional regulator [Pseudonocardia humida]
MATPGAHVGDAHRLSEVAAALAAPTRAAMACLLLAGTAHTGRELARHVGVAPSTASEHLAHLLDAGLLAVEVQGRHRYYRLADAEVAALLERMLTALPEPPSVAELPGPRLPAGMAFARSCYDHLAGRLGVALHDRLVELDAIRVGPDATTLTEGGVAVLADMGVTAARERTRPLVRPCLDWSQRRHHLAGTVGARLLTTLLERRWLLRNTTRPRELRLSRTGRDGLRAHLGIEVS